MAAPDFADRLAGFGSEVYRRLRPAQAHVLDLYSREHTGTADVAIELPTGEGKTLIALLIGDWALDEGLTVAYLTGTNQLADQVETQAGDLPGLAVHRFSGGNYPGAALDDYHQAQAIGVMNYWVYFNSSPRVARRGALRRRPHRRAAAERVVHPAHRPLRRRQALPGAL